MTACAELTNAIPLLVGLLSPFIVIYVVLFVWMRRKVARLSRTAAERLEVIECYREERKELLKPLY